MIQAWKTSFLAFQDRRILSIFLFGFSSGLPFLLTLSTLTLWLKESGLSNKIIGLFVIVTIPYTFKFLWGPLVDKFRLPLLFKVFGQRRSWALFSQIALIFMLLGLSMSNPKEYIIQTALWAFGVASFSAIQDIAVESYRIEIVDEDQSGSAASSSYLGYRLGMMVSGVGALYLATIFSWMTAYIVMAALIGVGIITTIFSPSPRNVPFSPMTGTRKTSFYGQLIAFCFQTMSRKTRRWARNVLKDLNTPSPKSDALIGRKRIGIRAWIKLTYGIPLKDLLKSLDWRMMIALIVFYKIGDTTLSVMNIPFLVEIGFSKLEIANIAKFFGISTMILGGILGGIFLNRYGVFTSLMLAAVLQILTATMFIIQSIVGYDLQLLTLTIGIENLGCGLGAAAFIAYLSSLCRTPYTATHFALLSSLGSFTRIILSVFSGFLADYLPWSLFFTFIGVTSAFFLLLVVYAAYHATQPLPSLKTI